MFFSTLTDTEFCIHCSVFFEASNIVIGASSSKQVSIGRLTKILASICFPCRTTSTYLIINFLYFVNSQREIREFLIMMTKIRNISSYFLFKI